MTANGNGTALSDSGGSGDERCFEAKILKKLSSLIQVRVEPVGRWFEANTARRLRHHSHSVGSLPSSSSEEESVAEEVEEEDDTFLGTLCPTEWKNQDHYKVLGLFKLRYKATSAQIKAAYKRKVLRHHPDKRKARGEAVLEESKDYFPCITRAWEVLGVPQKRRAFDSVDPEFQDSVPSESRVTEENYFTLFTSVFQRNARWSKRQPVPQIGDNDANLETVDRFYSFWFDFDSWREYSYLDEEDKEKGEDRYERRWIEKQNKEERKRRKKDEMARLRKLVDLAHKLDPRVARFKREEKQKREDEKQARRDAARKRVEDEQQTKKAAEEAERKKKEEEERAAKEQAAAAKKEREAQKKVIKKERKTLRTVAKERDYFCGGDDAKRVEHMAEVGKLAELLDILKLQELNVQISVDDAGAANKAFLAAVARERAVQEAATRAQVEALHQGGGGAGAKKDKGRPWQPAETQALTRALQVVPQGTANRWEVVAQFMAQHCPGCNRTAKEVLAKSKALLSQENAAAIKEDLNKRAFEHMAQTKKEELKVETDDTSARYMTVGEQQAVEGGTNPSPWSADEQKLLEQALRTYPASVADRWDQIAGCLPARTRKDCIVRYKELVELVKAKKAAAAKAKK